MSTLEFTVQVDFTPGLLQINFNRRSTELQPMSFQSTAATGSVSNTVEHNGQPGALVGQHKRVGTRLLVQHQREPSAPRHPQLPGLPDLGLGELVRWGAKDREGC